MRSSLALVAAALICANAGCADFTRGPAPKDAGNADASGALVADPVFVDSVYPLLVQDCEFCHMEGGTAETSRLVLSRNAQRDYMMVVALVTPGDPASSRLLLKAIGVETHDGYERFGASSDEYKLISDWIAGLDVSTNARAAGAP